jgi:hypothetical protein
MQYWLKCAAALVLAVGCVVAVEAGPDRGGQRNHGRRSHGQRGHGHRHHGHRGHHRRAHNRRHRGHRHHLRAARFHGRNHRYFGRFSHRAWSGRFGRWNYWSPMGRRWFSYAGPGGGWAPVAVAELDGLTDPVEMEGVEMEEVGESVPDDAPPPDDDDPTLPPGYGPPPPGYGPPPPVPDVPPPPPMPPAGQNPEPPDDDNG